MCTKSQVKKRLHGNPVCFPDFMTISCCCLLPFNSQRRPKSGQHTEICLFFRVSQCVASACMTRVTKSQSEMHNFPKSVSFSGLVEWFPTPFQKSHNQSHMEELQNMRTTSRKSVWSFLDFVSPLFRDGSKSQKEITTRFISSQHPKICLVFRVRSIILEWILKHPKNMIRLLLEVVF